MAEKPKPPVSVVISPEDIAYLMSEVSAAAAKQAAKFVTPKEAKGDAGRVASVDAVPSLEVEAEIKIKNDQIKQMIILCEGQPGLASFLPKLRTLLGTNPDDAELQLLDQEIQEQSKPDDVDVPAPKGVDPVKRNVSGSAAPVAGGKALTARRRVTFSVIPDKPTTPDDSGVKEKDPRLEKFLADIGKGETLVLVSAGGARLNFTREGDGFVNNSGATAMGDIVKRLNKGWTREGSVDSAVVVPVSIEEAKELELPKIGFEALYKDEFGVIIKVIRISGDHFSVFLDKELDDSVSWNTEILKDVAQNQKWELVSITPIKSAEPVEDKPGTIESGVLAAAIGAEGVPTAEKGEERPVVIDLGFSVESPEKSSIEELKSKVAGMRLEYVTTDYKQNSAWVRLKRIFRGNISAEPNSADMKSAREHYESALNNLREAELAELKVGMLTGAELRERMGQMLNYYKYTERVNLALIRDQVAIEGKGRIQKCVSVVEELGRWYNKQPLWRKLLVGGVVLGSGAAASFGALGGGAAAVAGGTALIRRLVTTAGAAVSADVLSQAGFEWMRKYGVNKEQEAELGHLADLEREGGGISSEGLSQLESLLERDIKLLDQKFKTQGREEAARKFVVWGAAAVGAGWFLDSYLGHGTGISGGTPGIDEEQKREYLRSRESSGKVGLDPTVAASEQAASAPAALTSAPSNVTPQSGPTWVRAAVPSPDAVSVRGSGLLKEYTVTAADGKRGLWGILDGRLPENIPKGPGRNRIIQSLESAMRAKLDTMSPAERVAAGFPKTLENGKVNLDFIRRGDTIDFSKLLTQQEIQSVLDGQSVGAPHVADKIVGIKEMVSGSMPERVDLMDQLANEKGVGFEKALDHISDKNFAAGVSANDAYFAPKPDVLSYDANLKFLTDPKQFLIDNPGQAQVLREAVGKVRMEIFMMNPGEGDVPMQYDYALNGEKLGSTPVSQVLKDLKGFERFNIAYDRVKNPLHYDQMKELAKFMTATEKTFGDELAQPKAGESIREYTGRMATAALRTGKAIKGFYVPGIISNKAA